MTEYHVAKTGDDGASGTAAQPFLTIGRAAKAAQAGDDVVVHRGVYREWVAPENPGLSNQRRITFTAAPGEHVAIKGSEPVTGWTPERAGVWRVTVDNALFGDFNPFAQEVQGDWLVRPGHSDMPKHLGDVYLNGRSLYEASSPQEVATPPRRETAMDDCTGLERPAADPDWSQRVWHARVEEAATTIWANFGAANPNTELVEINVRRSVFYPRLTGRDYITVRGFELAQAACPWAPPTADQTALIGPNWAKGWIIEDNDIHDAKGSAVSIGKEASTGDNFYTRRRDKPGYQYQLESVLAARGIGWSRERIGSHVIRRNLIHHCGQNGIVGHLGCVFSQIYDNRIWAIALKREFFGHEIAGIKLHAPIDVEIRHNLIHDCTLGIWLDWQAQGVRVTANVLHANSRDLFVEVSHGPYTVDHNIFGSAASVEVLSQGGAFVGNLICGTLRLEAVMDRATPYHWPHSTQVKGYAVVRGGDDRWIGNIFLGSGGDPDDASAAYNPDGPFIVDASYGTARYAGHPGTFKDYVAAVTSLHGDWEVVKGLKQPVYLRQNLYLGNAAASPTEEGANFSAGPATVSLHQEADAVWLAAQLPPELGDMAVPVQSTATLGRTLVVDADFEAPDGSALVLDTDLVGAQAIGASVPGPVFALRCGPNRIRVW
ncbi:MAG: right-handed parallel beta-helix repeat-containing protein [Bifidobacteriaceae bacterium]|jgi:hypothetical protein|nr:right-handed parallel beta-helix repeat-containing protein [Bifidobacteriaceae bacterium]